MNDIIIALVDGQRKLVNIRLHWLIEVNKINSTSTGRGNTIFFLLEKDRALVPASLQDFTSQWRWTSSPIFSLTNTRLFPQSGHTTIKLQDTCSNYGALPIWPCVTPGGMPNSQPACLQCWTRGPWRWTLSLFYSRICGHTHFLLISSSPKFWSSPLHSFFMWLWPGLLNPGSQISWNCPSTTLFGFRSESSSSDNHSQTA